MTFTFLGTGTSSGVPVLGCNCPVCTSSDPRDKRLRCAGLLENGNTRILIDCGPDIRQQLMPLPFKKINGVLLTHSHYDHVGGVDDLRPFCNAFDNIDLYGNINTVRGLKHNFPYCFKKDLYPGVPKLRLHVISPYHKRKIGDIGFVPIQIMHDKLPILGFRFGHFAYITDMKSYDEQTLDALDGIDTLVVNALRWEKPHHSHILVKDAIDFSERVGAKHTYLTHLTHHIGLYDVANSRLPEGFQFGYDGLQINL